MYGQTVYTPAEPTDHLSLTRLLPKSGRGDLQCQPLYYELEEEEDEEDAAASRSFIMC